MLGSGAYGSVVTDGIVATKTFHEHKRKGINKVSLLRELCAMNVLKDTNRVVRLYSFDLTSNSITMELCKGTLREWVDSNFGSRGYFDKCIEYIRQIMEGLMEIHDRKMVHGDLKLSNILIRDNGICIGDCGFTSLGPYSSVYHTAEAYRDPQVVAHPCHDCYSFVCTVYQMLTGQKTSYRDREKQISRPFKPSVLRENIRNGVAEKYRGELIRLLNDNWRERPTIRWVYQRWFGQDIPVWRPPYLYYLPEKYPMMKPLENHHRDARRLSLDHELNRFEAGWFALQYYCSEKKVVSKMIRCYCAALLFILNACFHLRYGHLNFSLEDATNYGQCNEEKLMEVISDLVGDGDFIAILYQKR